MTEKFVSFILVSARRSKNSCYPLFLCCSQKISVHLSEMMRVVYLLTFDLFEQQNQREIIIFFELELLQIMAERVFKVHPSVRDFLCPDTLYSRWKHFRIAPVRRDNLSLPTPAIHP